MIVINTTNHWNLGDDFIRDGVFNILKIKESSSKFFLNRSILSDGKRVYQTQNNVPSLDSVLYNADMFIAAGTPEWYVPAMFNACLKNNIPIHIIGAGMHGWNTDNFNSLKSCHKQGLIKTMTCRDSYSHGAANTCGIESKICLDPAFMTETKQHKEDKPKFNIVLNFRSGGGNQRVSNDMSFITTYLRLFEKYKNEIDLITTHELPEYITACKYFPKDKIFFSSDHNDYKRIYFNCKTYIGGRIHGTIPSYIGGAECHIIYNNQKSNIVKCANNILTDYSLSPINMYQYNEDINIGEYDPDEYLRRSHAISSLMKDHYTYFKG
jgi:hypothetical protein